jgi:hypothetical protein
MVRNAHSEVGLHSTREATPANLVCDAQATEQVARSYNPTAVDLLQHEFAQEKASALGRLGRALEAAIAQLARFDHERQRDDPAGESEQLRNALVTEASIALWHFVVQREACGLCNMRHVLRDYRVPPEVVARMGAQPQPQPPAARRSSRHEF